MPSQGFWAWHGNCPITVTEASAATRKLMRDHDHSHDQYRCPICGAKFESRSDLNDHDRRLHTQQGISGIAPSNVYPPPKKSDEAEKKDERSRKDREFNRSNWE